MTRQLFVAVIIEYKNETVEYILRLQPVKSRAPQWAIFWTQNLVEN